MNDIVEGLIKKAIYDYAKSAIMKALVTKLPFLGWAWLNPIVGFFLGKLMDIVYEHVYRAVSFAIIDIKVNAQKEAYDQAVVQLQEVLAKEQATEKEIEDAKKEFKEKFRDLIKFPVDGIRA